MKQPVIGITTDSEVSGGYSVYPWYALRQNYCAAVRRAGGIPIMLPHELEWVAHYVAMIDGLIVSGGNFDIDPKLFGAEVQHPAVTLKASRTNFEMRITEMMWTADKPILGICGGQQLLAVLLGGTLIQHIPDAGPSLLNHEQQKPRDQPSHDVIIKEGTLLHKIAEKTRVSVNSTHHQAVKDLPDRVIVDAVAPDGIIEGIEDPSRKFCIGVQWHPEFHVNSADARLFTAFVEVASYTASKNSGLPQQFSTKLC